MTICADPLTRLTEFTLSPFAALRAVRSGKANGLATLSPKGGRGSYAGQDTRRHL